MATQKSGKSLSSISLGDSVLSESRAMKATNSQILAIAVAVLATRSAWWRKSRRSSPPPLFQTSSLNAACRYP